MTARPRKGLACVSGAGVAHLSLIGPLLGVMLMIGGAAQVLPAMSVLIALCVALDVVVLRGCGLRSRAYARLAAGFVAMVGFPTIRGRGWTAP